MGLKFMRVLCRSLLEALAAAGSEIGLCASRAGLEVGATELGRKGVGEGKSVGLGGWRVIEKKRRHTRKRNGTEVHAGALPISAGGARRCRLRDRPLRLARRARGGRDRARSEGGRGGEECRSRWVACH